MTSRRSLHGPERAQTSNNKTASSLAYIPLSCRNIQFRVIQETSIQWKTSTYVNILQHLPRIYCYLPHNKYKYTNNKVIIVCILRVEDCKKDVHAHGGLLLSNLLTNKKKGFLLFFLLSTMNSRQTNIFLFSLFTFCQSNKF